MTKSILFIVLASTYMFASVDMLPTSASSSDVSSENEVPTYDFNLVDRSQWHARDAKETAPLSTPVPYVVIHHSYLPPACNDTEGCSEAMRSMQNFHMDGRGWWDIGYSFAVGSDGVAYEGRGWKIRGAHSLHFNTVSIGICLIGDWTESLPPSQQLKTTKALIEAGVTLGFIKEDYKLVGHRQVRDTECPGETLFQEIKTWEHYSSFPSSADDLIDVKEVPESVKEILRGNKVRK